MTIRLEISVVDVECGKSAGPAHGRAAWKVARDHTIVGTRARGDEVAHSRWQGERRVREVLAQDELLEVVVRAWRAPELQVHHCVLGDGRGQAAVDREAAGSSNVHGPDHHV